jgi:methyl-accepting chemotaxis protein
MSTVTRQTSEALRDQRSETEMVATAIHEMSATAKEVASSIAHTATASGEANEQTMGGSRIVKQSIDQINRLAKQIDTSSEAISAVEQYSSAISGVLDVIKGVAEQTNLLALNAAIEAARAGEQGRGFAVVADEVRTLAGRTQDSTTEINQMIENLQKNAKSAVQAMEESRQQAKGVVGQAENANAALNAISKSVAKIDQMSSQIATAAEEQSLVTDEMNRNIDHINNMAIQNATGSQQTSAAGMELSRMASSLKGLVEKFRV